MVLPNLKLGGSLRGALKSWSIRVLGSDGNCDGDENDDPEIEDADMDAERLPIVHEPKNCEVDIIAVHGLGEGFGSWTTRTKEGNLDGLWLKTLLPRNAPNARIMAYCYDAKALSIEVLVRKILYSLALDLVHRVKRRREGEAAALRRPLIFVAHSLGGLIVQRALVIASESSDPSLQDVELSTAGLLFFGTPSTARSAESLSEAIIRIARFSTSNRRRLDDAEQAAIRHDATWFLADMEAFKPIESRIKTESFIEDITTTFRTDSPPNIVVNPAAAFPGGRSYKLRARHSNLIKFDGPDDPGYKRFVDALGDMTRAAQGLVAKKWLVYDSAERVLSGRRAYVEMGFSIESWVPDGEQLMNARQHLVSGLEKTIQGCSNKGDLPIIVAHGEKGAGKTTLARHYCLKVLDEIRSGRSDLDFVFWIDAESRDTVVAGFLELARRIEVYYWDRLQKAGSSNVSSDRPQGMAQLRDDLGFPAVDKMLAVRDAKQLDSIEVKSAVKAVKNWLLLNGNRWLLVYDNVTGSFDLMEFLALHTHGHTIIISEVKNRCPWGRTEFEIPELSEEEALKELIPPEEELESSADAKDVRAYARRIVSEIGCRSRQISLAAAHLRPNPKPAQYQQYLQTLADPQNDIPWSAPTAPQKLVKQILSVVAFLSLSDIPHEILSVIPGVWQDGPLSSLSSLADKAHTDSDGVSAALATLIRENIMGTLKPVDRGRQPSMPVLYLVHRTARQWIRSNLWPAEREQKKEQKEEQMEEENKAKRMTCRSLIGAVKLYQEGHEDGHHDLVGTQAFGRLLLPHARECSAFTDVLEKDPEDWQVLGGLCWAHGDAESAICWYKLALKTPSIQAPEERTRVRLDLAAIYLERKDTTACRGVLGELDIKGIKACHGLEFRFRLIDAAEFVAEGRLDLAQKEFAALEKNESQAKESGQTGKKTILAVHKLAAALKAGQNFESAGAYYRRAYQAYKFGLGQYHPLTLDVSEEYADLLHLQGSYSAAEKIVTECIRAKEAMLGVDHPSTVTSIAKRATLLDLQGRFGEADADYATALGGMTQCFGKTNQLTVAALENQALSYWMRSGYFSDREAREAALDKAVELYGEVIKRKKDNEAMFKSENVRSSVDKLSEMIQNEGYLRRKLQVS